MKWRYLPSKRKAQRRRVKGLIAMDRACREIAAQGERRWNLIAMFGEKCVDRVMRGL